MQLMYQAERRAVNTAAEVEHKKAKKEWAELDAAALATRKEECQKNRRLADLAIKIKGPRAPACGSKVKQLP
jgi:hypothetical protein